MTEPSFSLRVIAVSDRDVRIIVEGEVDLVTSPELADALREEMRDDRAVVLDLAAVSFMDSSGLTVIIEAVNAAKTHGWSLGLNAQLTTPVRRIMELTAVLPGLPLIEE